MDDLNPMVRAIVERALGSILRGLLWSGAAFFVQKGWWSDGDAKAYVEGLSLALLGLVWSLRSEWKTGRIQAYLRHVLHINDVAMPPVAEQGKVADALAKAGVVTVLLLALASSASAQTTGEQKAADIARWGVAAVAIALDGAECRHSDNQRRCWITLGVRQGVVQVASIGIAKAFPSRRPCAPTCGIDNQDTNIPSRHTAATAATLPPLSEGVGPRLVVAVSATGLVGLFSGKATKHDAIGIATGAALGFGVSFIR